jgi:hypothetical protein
VAVFFCSVLLSYASVCFLLLLLSRKGRHVSSSVAGGTVQQMRDRRIEVQLSSACARADPAASTRDGRYNPYLQSSGSKFMVQL